MRKSALLILSATLLSACCMCKRGSSSAPLQGTMWTMVEYQGEPFEAQDNYHIIFNSDGTLSGVADCNSLMSLYTTDEDGGIEVENQALTRAMCQNDAMERKFMTLLEQADRYTINGNQLLWFDGDTEIAIFEAQDL